MPCYTTSWDLTLGREGLAVASGAPEEPGARAAEP
jgi:hypothetical protein